MSKKVIYRIDKSGDSKLVDMVGFGETCVAQFQETLSKLGKASGAVEYTAEYSKPIENQIDVQA